VPLGLGAVQVLVKGAAHLQRGGRRDESLVLLLLCLSAAWAESCLLQLRLGFKAQLSNFRDHSFGILLIGVLCEFFS